MSQQKDSNPEVDLGEPTATPVGESHPEAGATAGPQPEDAADAVADGTSAADRAVGGEPAAAAADEPEPVTGAEPEPVAGAESGTATGETAATAQSKPGRDATSAESDSAASESATKTGFGTRKAVTLGSIALLAVAAVAAAWFGGTWIVGGLLRDRPRAEARDAALVAAQQAAINITSMNLKDINGSVALARSSMTGDLLAASDKGDAQIKKSAADSNVNSTAKVVGGAVTELNSERDHAAALVVFEVTESGPDKPADKFRYTWQVDVTLDKGVWKADQVQSVADPVALGSAAPAPQNPAPATTAPQSANPQPGN
ncbi:hypothetical protein [Nocardia sp. NBC_01327]|uniref:hypothetical protein n=1 Tax=Nocardia sp. NBC_01327 TaxID=2903593 RepID=UPI002E0E8426|nr:hypothetical protein OG326_40545 [Nocardia sp. NBC_01327]